MDTLVCTHARTHTTVHPYTSSHAYTRAQKHTDTRTHAHRNKSGFLKMRPIWVSPSLALFHHIRNDLGSSLSQETRYTDWRFSRFPLFLHKNSGMLPLNRPQQLPTHLLTGDSVGFLCSSIKILEYCL